MAKAPPTPAVPALGLHVTPALGAAGPRGPLPAGRPLTQAGGALSHGGVAGDEAGVREEPGL